MIVFNKSIEGLDLLVDHTILLEVGVNDDPLIGFTDFFAPRPLQVPLILPYLYSRIELFFALELFLDLGWSHDTVGQSFFQTTIPSGKAFFLRGGLPILARVCSKPPRVNSKPSPKTRSTKNTPTKRELFVSPKDYNGYLMFKLINTPGCVVLFREHDWLQPGSAL